VLIIFGVLVRLILWPLNQRAMESSLRMQAVGPLIKGVQDRYKNEPDRLQREMLKIYRELPATALLKRMAIRTYLNTILFLLLKHYTSHLGSREIVDQERRTKRLQPVFDLLEANFARPIEVQDAARVCAMSCSHFMKFFKMTVGQTFCTYLTSFRIARAQHLLLDNQIPIAEISQLVGFCSQSYFGEVFRSIVGITPRAYRQRSIQPVLPSGIEVNIRESMRSALVAGLTH